MKIDELIKELNSLTIIDAIQLARELERRWGVSSAVKIVIFNPATDEDTIKEQEEFNVLMVDCGPRKIEVIKILRQLIPDLGLKEAKDIAESRGLPILQHVGRNFAFETKERLEEVGAEINIV